MRALLIDPSAPRGLRLGEAAEPTPAANQAVVEVKAISLNYGEVAGLQGGQAGEVNGWDAAGVVVEAAANGTGPAVGSRVVTFDWGRGWAQLRAVDTGQLAVVPDGVDLGEASALPVAAGTALQALRRLGSILGRRVLITGASGGVGRFAVQLAAKSGAHVIASVGSVGRGDGLRELGADEVVVGVDGVEAPLHGVLDNVGGPNLARAFGLLAEGGVIQSIGATSAEPTVFEPYATVGAHRRLESFRLDGKIADDLAYLAGLLDTGALDPQVGWRGGWESYEDAIEALLSRKVAGKAVLDVA
ncbi:MAG: zinc-binding dehydrogenase [Kutzneria sp.]|nr:zinc-binding dehydrogenase [Kutzneria sp.]